MNLSRFSTWFRSGLLIAVLLVLGGRAALGAGECTCEGNVNSVGPSPESLNILDAVAVADCAAGDCAGCDLASCDVNCDGTVDNTDTAVAICIVVGGVDCCNQPVGACTGYEVDPFLIPGTCFVGPQLSCEHASLDGTYLGDDSECTPQLLGIPASSEWGLAVFAILLLTAGSLLVPARRGDPLRSNPVSS